MSDPTLFKLKFWGTRGSIPCPGPDTVKYGGNTTCFEITCGSKRIIIDAGTGIRLLGKKIMIEEGNLLDADLFFTHTHMDHIQGLPFFAPLYNPISDVRLHAGHLTTNDDYDLRGIIGTMLMKDPVFPVPSSLIEQACSFKDFFCGHVFELGDGIVIRTGKLNHPNGACGYRIEFQGKAIAICTDTEHYDDRIDENIVTLAKDADVNGLRFRLHPRGISKVQGGGGIRLGRKRSRWPKPPRSNRPFFSIMIRPTAMRRWIKLPKKLRLAGKA